MCSDRLRTKYIVVDTSLSPWIGKSDGQIECFLFASTHVMIITNRKKCIYNKRKKCPSKPQLSLKGLVYIIINTSICSKMFNNVYKDLLDFSFFVFNSIEVFICQKSNNNKKKKICVIFNIFFT